MEKKFSLKEVIVYIEKHIAILTIIFSTLSLCITSVFKIGAYLYYRGYYDYWRIPEDYITLNYRNILYKFLITMISVGILIGLSYLYTFWWKKILKKELWYKKVRSGIGAVVTVILGVIVVEFLYLIIKCGISIKEIFLYIEYEFISFISNVISLSVFCIGVFFLFGIIIEFTFEGFSKQNKREDTNIERNNHSKYKKYIKSIAICFFTFFLADIAWLGYNIYDMGRSSILNSNKLNIVSIQGNDYVVISKYENRWILKECKLVGDKLKINHDHYIIEDIVGENIYVKFLKEGEKIEDCVVNNEEY